MIKSIILLILFCFIVSPVTSQDDAYKEAVNKFLKDAASKVSEDDMSKFKIKYSLKELCLLKSKPATEPPETPKADEENETAEATGPKDEIASKPNVKTDSKSDTDDVSNLDTETDAKPESETDANPESETAAKPESETDLKPDDESVKNSDDETVPNSDSEKSENDKDKADNNDAEAAKTDDSDVNSDAEPVEIVSTSEETVSSETETMGSLTREPELEQELEECEELNKELAKKAKNYDLLLPYTKELIDYVSWLLEDAKRIALQQAELENQTCEEQLAAINALLGKLDNKLKDANQEIESLKGSPKDEAGKNNLNPDNKSIEANVLDDDRGKDDQGEDDQDDPDDYDYLPDDYPDEKQPDEYYDPEYDYLPDDYPDNTEIGDRLIQPRSHLRGSMRRLNNNLKGQLQHLANLEKQFIPLREQISRLAEGDEATASNSSSDDSCDSLNPKDTVTFTMTEIGEMVILKFDMYDLNPDKVTYTVDFTFTPTYESSEAEEMPMDIRLLGIVIIKANTLNEKKESVRVINLKMDIYSIESKNADVSNEFAVIEKIRSQVNPVQFHDVLYEKMLISIEDKEIANALKHR